MRVMNISYPETLPLLMNLSSGAFEDEAKMTLAVKFFEMGKLTSGQAAELAGVDRVQFLLQCPRYGVPSVIWDQEEIQAEFEGKA